MILEPAAAARIEAAFDEAQRRTRAPLTCVLAGASVSREPEFLLGACILALATPLPLLLFTELSAQRIYIAQLLVGIVAAVLGSLPFLRRLLVPRRAERSACHRAALAQFVLRGLDRSQCGVLVYVSLAEHYIRVVPAEDAAKAVTQDRWQAAVDNALTPLAAGEVEAALTAMADRCADLLTGPFPPGAPAAPPPRQRFHVV
jgi:putative membrane protein